MKENIKKKKCVAINGKKYYHKDDIEGTIYGSFVTGKLYIDKHDDLYFCQNDHSGNSTPNDNNLGYKFAWVFNIENGVPSNDVVIHDVDYIKGHYSIRNSVRSVLKSIKCENYFDLTLESTIIIKGNDKPFTGSNNSTSIFKYRNHPDCCGCKIAYNFFKNNEITFTENDYNIILNKLKSIHTPILAHLADHQKDAIAFVEKIGFKKLYTYKNPNSSNDVTLYQFELNNLINENSESW